MSIINYFLFSGSTQESDWLLPQLARCDIGCSPVTPFTNSLAITVTVRPLYCSNLPPSFYVMGQLQDPACLYLCLSVHLYVCPPRSTVFPSASLSVRACLRAQGADGCRPMSQTEVTFTLPESNTDLNQLKHNQRGEIAQIQGKGEKESFTHLEQ